MSSPKLYKLRAECQDDWNSVKNPLGVVKCNIEYTEFEGVQLPDVEVEFESAMTLDQIREIMGKFEDSHVMIESLNYSHLYTGERWYDDDY